ncbi:uncharacterized protein LOC143023723 [Oratosquilla oratoria]|uniref:uncharacterized protein LOC143023723 n=1 Tax=Oratosquilla oratoria TaxID=337810 RepID=UPI003F75A427
MQKLPGEMFTLRSTDSVADEDQAERYPTEFLSSLNISGMPPHIINLIVGSHIIMFLRNLDQKNRHCNRARFKVLPVSNNLITASKITGIDAERTLLIPRIILQSPDTDLSFTMRRRDFPIRPDFAMSINKSQGQSFSKCGICLPQYLHIASYTWFLAELEIP